MPFTEWWMQSGTTSTDAGTLIPRQAGTADINPTAVTGVVTDTRIKTKFAMGMTPSFTSSQANLASSGYVLWKPSVNLTVTAVNIIPQSSGYSPTTCAADVITIWSCVGGVMASWTATATGTQTIGEPFTNVTAINSSGASIAASAPVLAYFQATTCSGIKPALNVQFSYTTTG